MVTTQGQIDWAAFPWERAWTKLAENTKLHLLNRKDGVSFSLLSLVTQCDILSRKGSGLGVLSVLSVEQTLGSKAGGCHFNSRALLRSAVVWLLLRLLTQRPTDRYMTAHSCYPWDSRYGASEAKLSCWNQKSLLGLKNSTFARDRWREDSRQGLWAEKRWWELSQTTKYWYLQGIVCCVGQISLFSNAWDRLRTAKFATICHTAFGLILRNRNLVSKRLPKLKMYNHTHTQKKVGQS